MSLSSRLAAAGCSLPAPEFRRLLLDTLDEYYDDEHLPEILTDPAASAVYCSFLASESGRDDIPADLAIETLGRLLGGDGDKLDDDEVEEVMEFHGRRHAHATAQIKRYTAFYREKFGEDFMAEKARP